MPKLSQRADRMPASPIRRLVPYADAARDRGVHVHHLNIGQPDIATPRPMIEAFQNYNEDVLAYGPSLGLPALRQAVADLSWLLERGYAEKSSLKLVGDRYDLLARQRTAVGRCACSDADVARRSGRRVGPEQLVGRPT